MGKWCNNAWKTLALRCAGFASGNGGARLHTAWLYTASAVGMQKLTFLYMLLYYVEKKGGKT